MKNDTVIGIDLAKNVFQACVVDSENRVLANKQLKRNTLLPFLAQQPSAMVAMEACYSSHYWGRECERLGHTVKLLPAQHVKPFVRGNKNDHNDALAIAEAARRPNIISVPVKSVAQQDIQALHRIRERQLQSRLRLSNQTRGLLSEYGVVFATGHRAFREGLREVICEQPPRLSERMRENCQALLCEYLVCQERIDEANAQIATFAEHDPNCQILMSIPGIGPLIASGIVSAIDQGQQFNCPRDFAVWLGLTPRHRASGPKLVSLGISKRGNRYLRTLFMHGARAYARCSRRRDDKLSRWTNDLIARRGYHKAIAALAHKLARIAWSLLRKQESYRP